MSFNRFSHEDRQGAPDYRLPGHARQPQQQAFAQGPYTREAPRYDPSRQPAGGSAIAPGVAGMPPIQDALRQPPQVIDYSPKEGGPGTTFTATVDIGNMDSATRQFRFVFGSRRVGAFLEGRRGYNTCTLSAGVPRFEDTSWWSNKVPVYLAVVDMHTDQDLHTIQIGEFNYISSPGRAKRARDDELVGMTNTSSPVRRVNSTNSQRTPYGSQLGHGHYSEQSGHRLGHRPTSSYASMNPALMGQPSSSSGGFMGDRGAPAPLALQDPPVRYIAEPRDQFPAHTRAPSFSLSGLAPADEHPYHADNRQSPSYLSVQQPGGHSAYGYQPSPTSATFRSPFSGTNNYMSPPHSATFPKSESSYDQPFPSADSEASSDTPTLQRTSTMSASSRRAPTPSAPQPANWMPSAKAKLDVMGNLDDISRNWSSEEFGLRRRLVQFWRKQDGNIIRINFRPVEPGATRSPHAVIISCIYWEERQECFFTSVDAIFLLESLIGYRFAVEEKNRIRRNLEGFRPQTVSKGKADSEEFFKLIMAFPAPKPRNIEKDVKAFPWRILTPALRKIIGKYSASYNGLTETSAAGSSSQQSDAGASQPPAALPQLPQPQGGLPAALPQQAQARHAPDVGRAGGIPGGLGGAGGEMPPPAMRRSHDMNTRLPQQQASPGSVHGTPPTGGRSPNSAGGQQSNTSGPSPSKSPAANLSIQVPPNPVSTLPSLEGLATDLLDRRPSGGVPMTAGLGGLDFSDFMFASPGQMPSSASGWPGASVSGPSGGSGSGQQQPGPAETAFGGADRVQSRA